MTESTLVIVTNIMVVKLPNGTVFQVAGEAADIDLLKGLLTNLPREIRGTDWVVEMDPDSVYMNSNGEEVLRVQGGSAIRIPDVKCIADSKGG